MIDPAKIKRLREKRLLVFADRERADLRDRFGDSLVRKVNVATESSLSLKDFQPNHTVGAVDWPPDIRNAPGLVAAYVTKARAQQLMRCVSGALGRVSGMIGFHDKDFIGFAPISSILVDSMVEIAESTMESVLFYVEESELIVMVDCYGQDPETKFSVLIQNSSSGMLDTCFNE